MAPCPLVVSHQPALWQLDAARGPSTPSLKVLSSQCHVSCFDCPSATGLGEQRPIRFTGPADRQSKQLDANFVELLVPVAPEAVAGPVNASCEHSGINDLAQVFFWRARPPRRPLSIQVRPIAADVDYRRIRTNSANWTHHGLEWVDLETPWEPPPLFRSS
jgi:hypothetical protein